MKRLISTIFNRVTITAAFMLLQVSIIVAAFIYFQEKFFIFYSACVFVSVCVVIYIINENSNPAYKIAWIIPIMVLPVFGGLLYLMFGKNRLTLGQKRRLGGIQARYRHAMSLVYSSAEALRAADEDGAMQAAYLSKAAGAPVFTDTETTYFPIGDVMFLAMLEELKKAKRYIFLEYFIIEPGFMWDSILEILTEKAAAGVDVRVLYDDFGCIFTLPGSFRSQMKAVGIKCQVFHRFVPVLSGRFNNRDHRKICVVDGRAAFTGGINLADEYINKKERFGHWLDSGILVRGAAAWGFTVMFLSMWDYVNNLSNNYIAYKPEITFTKSNKGFVIPFSDVPLDNEPVGETAYMNMITRAKSYVYLTTPYLVPGNEMIQALVTAAKCGVDVRIITPHIPDKKTIFALTQSNYKVLVEAGVRIFEYTPGFIHSKIALSDDKCGIVGTINMDFRSMYLHYECAAWMWGTDALTAMKDSYLKTLESCEEITPKWCNARPLWQRIFSSVIRVFAPLA